MHAAPKLTAVRLSFQPLASQKVFA